MRETVTKTALQRQASHRIEEAKVEYSLIAVAGYEWAKVLLTNCFAQVPP